VDGLKGEYAFNEEGLRLKTPWELKKEGVDVRVQVSFLGGTRGGEGNGRPRDGGS